MLAGTLAKKSSRSLYDYLYEWVQFSLVPFLLNNTITQSPPTNRRVGLTFDWVFTNHHGPERSRKRTLHHAAKPPSNSYLSTSRSRFSLSVISPVATSGGLFQCCHPRSAFSSRGANSSFKTMPFQSPRLFRPNWATCVGGRMGPCKKLRKKSHPDLNLNPAPSFTR